MANHLHYARTTDDESFGINGIIGIIHIHIEQPEPQHNMCIILQFKSVKTSHDNGLSRGFIALAAYGSQFISAGFRKMKHNFCSRLCNINVVRCLLTTVYTTNKSTGGVDISNRTESKYIITSTKTSTSSIQIYLNITINIGHSFFNISPSDTRCIYTESIATDKIHLDITMHCADIRATHQLRFNIRVAFHAYIDIAINLASLSTAENTQVVSAKSPAGNHHFHGTFVLAPLHHLCPCKIRVHAGGKDFTDSSAIYKNM